ncbi:hypothetical protein [Oryzobacter terrae]|uniref:hypothetical protein n=1 Tax=Oryzobacter terrae TaxID=1620385 RepID=UPI00366AFBC2
MTEQHPDTDPEVVDEVAPDPVDDLGAEPTPSPTDVPAPPETGDIVIDAALRDLAQADPDDLDAQLATGEAVHRTLQSRLSDLGG